MGEVIGYNANRGTWYEHDYDEATQKTVITTKQDVQPILDRMSEIRNSGHGDSAVKGEFWHYASIPAHVELELRQKGINIYDPNHQKAMFRELNQNYPHLKTTRLKHE